MKFVKMHGLSNDYIFADTFTQRAPSDPAAAAVSLSRPHTGVGADGIVLLEHVNHHMENGIGLRQIVDWMMFADKCLPDEKWPQFRDMARRCGLEKLAVAVTRMCEIYMGLPRRSWCAGADEGVCRDLMEYVLSCGNFGRKRDQGSRASASFFSSTRSPVSTLRFLQNRGMITWKAAQDHAWLRPFAWLHQAGRYMKAGFRREKALSRLKAEIEESRRRNELFDAVGIAREQYGYVVSEKKD